MELIARPQGADTRDIVESLLIAAPGAIEQAKKFTLPYESRLTGSHIKDAKIIGLEIQKILTYKADGFKSQKIKLPSYLLKQNKPIADCKSFSLLFLAYLTKAGIKNGLKFAAYNGGNLTHVYNFVEVNGKKYNFDTTRKNLEEFKNYSNSKMMQVEYLGGVPVLVDVSESAEIGRIKLFKKSKNNPKPVKKILLAPARGAFLTLVSFNFRALASKLAKMKQDKLKAFWQRLGGDINKLNKAINTGKGKKALFGGKVNGFFAADNEAAYIGEPISATALLSAAGSIILAVSKFLKANGEKLDDESVPPGTLPIDEGGGFEIMDKEKAAGAVATTFKPSTGLIIGGVAAAGLLLYMVSKKK